MFMMVSDVQFATHHVDFYFKDVLFDIDTD